MIQFPTCSQYVKTYSPLLARIVQREKMIKYFCMPLELSYECYINIHPRYSKDQIVGDNFFLSEQSLPIEVKILDMICRDGG